MTPATEEKSISAAIANIQDTFSDVCIRLGNEFGPNIVEAFLDALRQDTNNIFSELYELAEQYEKDNSPDEVAAMEEQTKKLEKEIEDLKSEIRQKSKDIYTKDAELESLRELKPEFLEKKVAYRDATIEELRAELRIRTRKIDSLSGELQSIEARHKIEIESLKVGWQGEAEYAAAEIRRLQEKVSKLPTNVEAERFQALLISVCKILGRCRKVEVALAELPDAEKKYILSKI